MMDPYGIYGTRSAARMRAARQRRKVQGVLWVFTVIGLMAAIITGVRVQRVASVSNDWRLSLMARPSGAPVWAELNGGTLLVPTESGQLLAGTPSEGSDLRPVLQADFPLRAEPLVVGDVAYIACEDGALHALSLRNSKRLWRFPSRAAMTARPAYLEYSVAAPAAVATPIPQATPASGSGSSPATTPSGSQRQIRKTIITGNDQGLVSALDANNGRVRWQRRLPAPVGSGLVATELAGRSMVLVPLLSGLASRGGLWCLDARTNVVIWKFPDESKTLAAQLPSPVVKVDESSGRVYAVNDSGAAFCLDLKTGRKIAWQKAYVPPAAGHDEAVLLRVEPLLEQYDWGERLIVAATDGGVHCLDTGTGKIVWSFEAPAAIHCRPLALKPEIDKVSRPIILVGCDAANVYAVDAQSGALVWKLKTSGPSTTGLVRAPDGVLVVSSNGTVQKFTPR